MGSADFRLIRPVGVTADGAFIRPSSKSVFDETGTLVQVPAGSFAVTYDPSDLTTAPYALVEPAATNLCGRSTNLNVGWSAYYGMFPNAGKALAPDGTLTAYGIQPSVGPGATGLSLYYASNIVYTWTAGVTYCLSGFVKAAKYSIVSIGMHGSYGAGFQRTFDLSGTSSIEGTGYGADYVGNGWFRVWVTITPSADSAGPTACFGISGGVPAEDPSISAFYLWGPQIEIGNRPSSYIQTPSGFAVTRAADGIAAGAGLVYSNVPITEPSYSGAATYAKDAQVYDPSSRVVYQSLTDANTGKALTDTTAWTPQLATNRWRMFDKAVNSQTSAPDLLVVAIKPGQLVNALGLLNVAGSSVTVTQTDSYYVQSKSLVRHDVLNWYDFFYEEPIREGDVMFDGIPPYANSTLVITVTNPGDAAAIGCCVLGKSRTIGQTAWDFTGGILSYSSSATDKFGNVTLVKRDNSKVLNFEVYIPSGFESEAYRLLRECTDVELMIVGAEDYSMTYSYGYLGQWSVPVTNSAKTAHIEFKGLV